MHSPGEWEHLTHLLPPDGGNLRLREMNRRACQVSEVKRRYSFIRNGREALRRIARADLLDTVIPTELVIRKDEGGRATPLYDPIYSAILGEKIDYIRECAVCGRLFFAGRTNQDACSPDTCAKTLRKRRERNNAKLRAKQEFRRRKLKKR